MSPPFTTIGCGSLHKTPWPCRPPVPSVPGEVSSVTLQVGCLQGSSWWSGRGWGLKHHGGFWLWRWGLGAVMSEAVDDDSTSSRWWKFPSICWKFHPEKLGKRFQLDEHIFWESVRKKTTNYGLILLFFQSCFSLGKCSTLETKLSSEVAPFLTEP